MTQLIERGQAIAPERGERIHLPNDQESSGRSFGPEPPSARDDRRTTRGRELLAGATLPAGALQHLLVLLLAHALAALLDQRSHGGWRR